ncbi:MAG: hypothetical protein LAP40_23430 [Acidobacteriia bacterium]|nr:hypothetical protein [Terriglobia bacterium]
MSLGALIGGAGNAGGRANYTGTDIYGRPVAVGPNGQISYPGGDQPRIDPTGANYVGTDTNGRQVAVGPGGQISYPGASQISAAMLQTDPSADPSAPGKRKKAQQPPPDLPMGAYTRMGLDQQGGLADSLLNFRGGDDAQG